MVNKNSDISYLIIINPKAGIGISNDNISAIKSFFNSEEIKYNVLFTSKRGDAEKIAKKGVSDGFTHLVSVGGDGTSSEIVNGIDGNSVCFGIIPIGSGNDFPKAAGISLNFKEALNNLIYGKPVDTDIAKCGEKYFINGFGVGLDGAVAWRFKQLKKFGGFMGYLLGAVLESFKFRGFNGSIETDNDKYSGKLLLFGASNGPFQGGKFKLAPNASVRDGLLDFHIIKDMSPIKRLIKIPSVLKGSHSNMEEVKIIRAESVKLEIDRELPAHMDGEPMLLSKGVHSIEILKKHIKVISPPNLNI